MRQNAIHDPHLLERANLSLPTPPISESGVSKDAKMLNNCIGKFMSRASQAIPGRCSDGCKHKDCFLAGTNFASFKRIGEGKPRQKPLTQ
jgi:hypothetical protein